MGVEQSGHGCDQLDTGQATANADFGSAMIIVDAAGAQEQVAQVAMTAPGPNTVLVPSVDVISVGPKQPFQILTACGHSLPQIADSYPFTVGSRYAPIIRSTRSPLSPAH
jgi:hypothetical protein